MAEETNNPNESVEYTEIEQTSEFYSKILPHLKIICDYEETKARIQESRMKNLMCTAKIAEFKGIPNNNQQQKNTQ